jgi:mycothiol system anti-sigma-R factor
VKPTRSQHSECEELAFAVETYLDGELDPSQVVEVEAHTHHCGACRERIALDRAIRGSLQQLARPTAPVSLRERMEARMQAERLRQEAREEALAQPRETAVSPESRGGFPLRYAVPFAAAAGFALFFSASAQQREQQRNQDNLDALSATAARSAETAKTEAARASVGLDGILDDLIQQHAQPLPPEVTRPDQVALFDPFIGVPVQCATPNKLAPYGATFVGGRMLSVRDKRAAMMQYKVAGNHRVTVYVYDPRRISAESHILRKQNIRNAPVYVGNHGGYDIAAMEKQGIGYALATDLGEPETAELVAAAAIP